MAGPSLRDEIGKKRPFDRPEEEVLLNLRRTDDALQAEFSRLFKPFGLSDPLYNILRILRGEGAPLPCLEVAGRMVTRVPDITRLVDRLEAKGLVARSRTSGDRRVVLVAITEAGLDTLSRLDGPVDELSRRLLGHLNAEELERLNALLVKARTAVAK